MKFVIRSGDPFSVAPELIRICEWLTNRFGEMVSISDPCTFTLLHQSNSGTAAILDSVEFKLPTGSKLMHLLIHSRMAYRVIQVMSFPSTFVKLSNMYDIDIIVDIDDAYLAVECKLACI
jgi:hypothetical protein